MGENQARGVCRINGRSSKHSPQIDKIAEADASAIACRTPSQPPPTAPYRGSAELSAFKQAVTETLVRQEWLEDLLSEDMDQ